MEAKPQHPGSTRPERQNLEVLGDAPSQLRPSPSARTRERTIAGPADIRGFGPFSGAECFVRLLPSPKGSGIVVRRHNIDIPCTLDYLAPDSVHSTSIASKGISFRAVEHLLSALYVCGVNNCVIESIQGPELPGEGSGACLFYAEVINAKGIVDLGIGEPADEVERQGSFSWNSSHAAVAPPSDPTIPCLELIVDIDFPDPIGQQTVMWSDNPQSPNYLPHSFMGARSFIRRDLTFRWPDGRDHWTVVKERIVGLPSKVSELKLMAFANGDWVVPPQFGNEPAWHKLVDLAADLTLIGRRLVGQLRVTRPGHAFNHRLAHWLCGSYESSMPITARLD